MKNIYIKNSITLSICLIVSKIIGAIYRIPLSNLLGSEGIGVYQMIYSVFALLLVFITGGMPICLSQRVAYYRAKNQNKNINVLLKNSMLLCILLGIIFFIFLCAFSRTIAIMQGNENSFLGFITISVAIVFASITCVYKGYFQGMENMFPPSIISIIEQIVKLIVGLSLCFALRKYGLIYSVCGALIGIVISEIASFSFMLIYYYNKRKKGINTTKYDLLEMKSIFKNFLPITLSGLVSPIMNCIDSFMVVNLFVFGGILNSTAVSLYGIETGMVMPIINFPILFCAMIGVALLPTLSFKITKKIDTSVLVGGTYFFILLVSIPCVLGVSAISSNIASCFFPTLSLNMQKVYANCMIITSMYIFFTCISQISISILNSYGHFKTPFVCQLIGAIVKFIMLVFLLPIKSISIYGFCFGIVFSAGISSLLLVYFTRKVATFKVNFKKFILVVLGGIFMLGSIMILNYLLVVNKYLKISIVVLVAIIVYFAFLLITRCATLKQLRSLLKDDAKSV